MKMFQSLVAVLITLLVTPEKNIFSLRKTKKHKHNLKKMRWIICFLIHITEDALVEGETDFDRKRKELLIVSQGNLWQLEN